MNLDLAIVIEFLKENPLIAMAAIFLVMWKNGGQTNILDMVLNFIKGLFVKPPAPQAQYLASVQHDFSDDIVCDTDHEVIGCMTAVARYCEENSKTDVANEIYDLMPNVLKKAAK